MKKQQYILKLDKKTGATILTPVKKYIIIDYFRNKQHKILNRTYKNRDDAFKDSQKYLKKCIQNNIIHNNLLTVKSI